MTLTIQNTSPMFNVSWFLKAELWLHPLQLNFLSRWFYFMEAYSSQPDLGLQSLLWEHVTSSLQTTAACSDMQTCEDAQTNSTELIPQYIPHKRFYTLLTFGSTVKYNKIIVQETLPVLSAYHFNHITSTQAMVLLFFIANW